MYMVSITSPCMVNLINLQGEKSSFTTGASLHLSSQQLQYDNTPMQYTANFNGCKFITFSEKCDISLFLLNIYTLIVGTRLRQF